MGFTQRGEALTQCYATSAQPCAFLTRCRASLTQCCAGFTQCCAKLAQDVLLKTQQCASFIIIVYSIHKVVF